MNGKGKAKESVKVEKDKKLRHYGEM